MSIHTKESVRQTILSDRYAWPSFHAAEEVSAGTLQNPSADFLWSLGGSRIHSGMHVSPETALAVTTVFACTNNISQDVGKLPTHLKKRLPENKGSEDAPEHAVWRVLHDQPNRWQTPYEFKQMMQGHLCLRGNAYARQIRDRSGELRELIPFHPDRVRLRIATDDSLFYEVRDRNGRLVTPAPLPQNEMFHLRGFSTRGYLGLSVISAGGEAVGLAMAAEQHDASLLAQGATLPGALSVPGRLKTDQQRTEARDTFQAIHGGALKAGKAALFEDGMSWVSIGVSPADLQLMEIRKFQIPEVARLFRMPLHKIQELERATNNNIEQQALEYVGDCLYPWFVCWEQAITRDLLLPEEQAAYFAKFNFDALLRADTLSRYRAHQISCGGPWKTRDEVRMTDDMNPMGGEMGQVLKALNMSTDPEAELDAARRQDAADGRGT